MKAHELNGTAAKGKTSTKEYEEYAQEIADIAGGNFVMVHLSHVRHFDGDGTVALTLSYILNQFKMKDLNKKDRRLLIKHKMWFRCPVVVMREHLNMTEKRAASAMKRLTDEGVVQTEWREGKRRWVYIDMDVLRRISGKKSRTFQKRVQNPPVEGSEPSNGGFPPTNKHTNKQKNSRSAVKDRLQHATGPDLPNGDNNTTPSKNGVAHPPLKKASERPIYVELAKLFLRLVREQSKMNKGDRLATPWASSFQQDCLREDVDPDRVNKALLFMLAHWNDYNYNLPKPCHPKHFMSTLGWIEQQMEKDAVAKKRKEAAERKKINDDSVT